MYRDKSITDDFAFLRFVSLDDAADRVSDR